MVVLGTISLYSLKFDAPSLIIHFFGFRCRVSGVSVQELRDLGIKEFRD
jgi:hypothetical protein